MSLAHPAGVPTTMPFAVSSKAKNQEIPGTPAGRPVFVSPGVLGTPGRCLGEASYVYMPSSFLRVSLGISAVTVIGYGD